MLFKILAVFSLAMGVASPSNATVNTNKKEHESLKGPPIREEMGGLFATISELLPLVISKAQFEDRANTKKIARLMNKLSALSSKMAVSSKKFNDTDPSIPFIAKKFSEDVRFSIEMWNSGDREVSRRLLRGATDYCISCHTRTAKGIHFSDVLQGDAFKKMPALAKAEYLAATRQFEDALIQYEHVLVDRPLAKLDPQAWDLAVRKMLAITVRVKADPSLTLEMISRIQDNPESMPASMRADIAYWRMAAKAWTEEKQIPNMNDDQKIALAEQLVRESDEWKRKIAGGALVQNMRASALLHDVLGKMRSGTKYQQALLLAGRSSEYLRDLNMWTLQDTYYESCIRVGGDSNLSKQCLDHLEASFLRTYGAASVAGLPVYPKSHLAELGRLVK